MKRTHYANGDSVSLSCGCDGCSPTMIQGILCHEHGCPDSWRDNSIECKGCGCDFLREDKHQTVCPDCANFDRYDDSMDGDHESGLASAGWGTDEDYGLFDSGDSDW